MAMACKRFGDVRKAVGLKHGLIQEEMEDNREEIFRMFDPQKRTLKGAIWRGDIESVRAFIEAGADVNARDAEGMTPLMYAAKSGNIESVRILIESGADVTAQDSERRTPLSLAAKRENAEIVRLLTEAGADVNSQGFEERNRTR